MSPVVPNETAINRWTVKRAISVNQSAFGDVYEVEDRDGIHGRAALKLYRAGLDLPDIRNLARARHPHIIGRLDDGAAAHVLVHGQAYMVMELATETFSHAMRSRNPAQKSELLDVALPGLLQALDYVHNTLKLVHRDVKPDNILLAGEWKLGDFGLTAPTNHYGYFQEGASGTLCFMAPELFAPGDSSVLVDVFAMGATVHQVLTGKCVWEHRQTELMENGAPPGRPVMSADVPARWRDFVGACLADKPDRPTAKEAQGQLPRTEGTPSGSVRTKSVRPEYRPALAVSSAGQGRLEVYRTDTEGLVWHRWFSETGGWSGWHSMPALPGGQQAGTLAAGALAPGHQEVFVGTRTGQVFHRWYEDGNDGPGWSGWHQMGDAPAATTTAPALACSSFGPRALELYSIDDSGAIWHRWFPGGDDANWSEWHPMPGLPSGLPARSLASGSHRPGHQELVAVDSSGAVFNRWFWRTDGWSDWAEMDGVPRSGDSHRSLALSSLVEGHHEVFLATTGGGSTQYWHRWFWLPDRLWSTWHEMPALPKMLSVSALAAGSYRDRLQELFAVTVDGDVWHCWNWLEDDGDSKWSSWQAM